MYYFERKMDEREVKSSTKNVGVGFSVLLLGAWDTKIKISSTKKIMRRF